LPPGLVLPHHSESPYRTLLALGETQAKELVDFIRYSEEELPGFLPSGIRWRPYRQEQLKEVFEGAARLEIPVENGIFKAGGMVNRQLLEDALATEVVREATGELEILATGAACSDAFLADKLMPVRLTAVALEGEGPQLCPEVSWHSSLRFIQEGRYIWAIGARDAVPDLEVGRTERRAHPRVVSALSSIAQAFYPGIASSPTQILVGITAESCDGLPIVGPIPGRPRTLVCTGFGSMGLGYGAGCAAQLVEGILTGFAPKLPEFFSASRFVG
jgi:hypothetical protein